ncbi:retrovirus-related pol polyprotein from transposon TNT 1-94 [Tanacetum coccineum]|uniref:Retrovirus-related pol polyprotein from transposon TNT 1-94 n=1 Tax=Tanacetum coccineum TaxID=301880 RepID=A0ABQ5IUJ3_9ASTR
MLNKDNYVPWYSRLLHYENSKPNGKLIYNSIMHGPYVRGMIPELGDPYREVPIAKTFHEHTHDEFTEKELKKMEADDQAIQIILMGLPEDIYAAVDSCETTQEIWLRVQQMMKGSDIGIQDKKAKLFNEWERFTSTDGESIESYYHRFSKLMNDFNRNKHFLEKIASNLKFLNNLQLEWRRHITIVHQTKDFHENGIIVVSGIANQNVNKHGNGNVVAARAEGNDNGNANNSFQIRCYNCKGLGHYARNCTVRLRRRDATYLQTQLLIAQKEEPWIQIQAKESDLMAIAGDINEIEEQYTKLLEPISEPHQVQHDDSNVISIVSSMEQSGGTVEQHSAIVEETQADESLAKHKVLKYEIERLLKAVASRDIMSVVQSNSVVDTSNLQTELDPYNDMQQKIERLQAQLGDLKGKSQDTPCVSDTLYPLSQKLENENVELEINPLKTSREDKFVPINKVRASIKTNPITVSQPHVITKKDVNSDSNGLSSTGVDNTTKTRRPQPKSNTKNDRIPSVSKSSYIKNKEVEV